MVFIALLTGVLAGVLHVLSGPDHLVAMSPYTVDARGKAWRVGIQWGFGHTFAVWLLAALAIFFKDALPLEWLSAWGERLVGVVLILIGLMALRKAIMHRVHSHEHGHESEDHAHFHMHASVGQHHEAAHHRHGHAPLGIGLLHGLAGGSHLIAIMPALLLPGSGGPVAYVLGYGLGSIGAMCFFSWVMGKLLHKWVARYAHGYSLVMAAFALLAVGLGIAWLHAA